MGTGADTESETYPFSLISCLRMNGALGLDLFSKGVILTQIPYSWTFSVGERQLLCIEIFFQTGVNRVEQANLIINQRPPYRKKSDEKNALCSM